MGLTYKDSGVDIQRGDAFVDMVREKLTPEERQNIGLFGGLFDLSKLQMENPVLVSSTDGVGTKLLIAKKAGRYETIGIDLVAMCVNDIAAIGARPLFFLDYIAAGKLDLDICSQILDGIVQGCRESNCALLGGETAEMPGVYANGDYELAGFAVGAVEKRGIVDGTTISANDVLIGLGSSGIHSNGLSLARKALFEMRGYTGDEKPPPLRHSITEELLLPTKIYTPVVQKLIEKFSLRGIAHITGGGLYANVKRIVPDGIDLHINWKSVKSQPVFNIIREAGGIDEAEMRITFNMGVGLCIVVRSDESDDVVSFLKDSGEDAYVIGETVIQGT